MKLLNGWRWGIGALALAGMMGVLWAERSALDARRVEESASSTAGFEPFIGEIRMFTGNFAPRGWALCDGQTLDIASNAALFSIMGTRYGGNGETNFRLPDLRGRVALHSGRGVGLTERRLGDMLGAETVALSESQMPSHNHEVRVSPHKADSSDPTGRILASSEIRQYAKAPQGSTQTMEHTTVSTEGAGMPHDNMPPATVVNYIIALVGVFPSPS